MITFDSFTLVPAYSDIQSRSEVDVSTTIQGIKSNLPIINANMHSICTTDLCYNLSYKYKTFSSYHRFFQTNEDMIRTLRIVKAESEENHNLFFPSIGVQKNDYKIVEELYSLGFKNVIIDVNHGHHKLVRDILLFIKENFKDMIVMTGNVSSNDGIIFLRDAGADIVKIGNSYGFSCSTRNATGYAVHPIHVAREYRNKTGDWDTALCVDGGIREVADIAKSLIWGNVVMIGKMFAGCDESNGKFDQKTLTKTYWGNASVTAKTESNSHVKYIEGKTTSVPYTGPMYKTLDSIIEGLQSAFSFVGARNLNEYQLAAANNILFI